VHIKYTFAHMCLPRINQHYKFVTWCPRAIKEKEQRSFSLADPRVEGLDFLKEAINTEKYTGSLKHNFFDTTTIVGNYSDDKVAVRGRKPHFKRIDKSLSLNFEGRVKKASRKNI
jgi:hypothetical protein